MLYICSKTLCLKLPKMDFQDQFIAINFGNISLTVKDQRFKVSGKEERRRFGFVDNGGQSSSAIYCQTKRFTFKFK